MKVTNFIKEKNAIVCKLTGITLVPEDQIKKVPKCELSFKNDASACPYYHAYWFRNPGDNCEGCPMYEAENGCNTDSSDEHTYHQLDDWVYENTSYISLYAWYQSVPELVDLHARYNKQFKDK